MNETDILIAGCGCSGLYCALNLPKNKRITIITKAEIADSDSFLAQGGMCTLKSADDFDSFFEDTLKAGHFENDKTSVRIMIESSGGVVKDLVNYGAEFHRDEQGNLAFTKEGGHKVNRIVYHKDTTGKEITTTLLREAEKRGNIEIVEHTTLLDIIEKDNVCLGAILRNKDGELVKVSADCVVLATGGIGGLYKHSTNFKHLTGDALAIAIRHGIKLKDATYVQIHPTTFYSEDERSFLISESVRGEGALLRDKNGNRFTNELLPRDLLTAEIRVQMEKDGTDFVWEDLTTIPPKELEEHFPSIVVYCKEKGYDVSKDYIPVVPAQHYYMGGIAVNHESKTSMERLYAVGETACNGVHGKNRLASNSLLESLVFARRAALDMTRGGIRRSEQETETVASYPTDAYADSAALEAEYRRLAKNEIMTGAKQHV